jgi:hypothetical protein
MKLNLLAGTLYVSLIFSNLSALTASQLDAAATAGTEQSVNPDSPSNVNPTQNSKANSDSRFFAGAHLGMSIKQCADYYKQFRNVGALIHSGAPPDQEEVDFRNDTVPQGGSTLLSERVMGNFFQSSIGNSGRRMHFPTKNCRHS